MSKARKTRRNEGTSKILKANCFQQNTGSTWTKNFSEVTKSKSNNSYNTLIFTDSIPKGIRMYQFNRTLRNRRAKMLNFLGAIIQLNFALHRCSFKRKISWYRYCSCWSVNDLLNGNSQFNPIVPGVHLNRHICKGN